MAAVLEEMKGIRGLRRAETFSLLDMIDHCKSHTRDTYSHDDVYGQFCTLEAFVDCPPLEAYGYLADAYNLQEWTYSIRDLEPAGSHGLFVGNEKIAADTRIFVRVVANPEALTVDYHCAWDQGGHLWMVYLMRVVPAPLVLDRPGSVVLWTNCRHPFYDKNPFPTQSPPNRVGWVGDLWPLFHAGHEVELGNLKAILEHRHRRMAIPIAERAANGMGT